MFCLLHLPKAGRFAPRHGSVFAPVFLERANFKHQNSECVFTVPVKNRLVSYFRRKNQGLDSLRWICVSPLTIQSFSKVSALEKFALCVDFIPQFLVMKNLHIEDIFQPLFKRTSRLFL